MKEHVQFLGRGIEIPHGENNIFFPQCVLFLSYLHILQPQRTQRPIIYANLDGLTPTINFKKLLLPCHYHCELTWVVNSDEEQTSEKCSKRTSHKDS